MSRGVFLSEGTLATEAGSLTQAAVPGAATDSLVAHLAGIETLTGAKTFSAATTTLSAGGVLSTTQAGVPTIPSPASGFGTISFAAGSSDTAGQITFTVSGTPAASAVAMPVVFNVTKTAAPKGVQLTMGDSSVNDPITLFYVPAASLATTGWTIATNATGAAQAAKILYYTVDF